MVGVTRTWKKAWPPRFAGKGSKSRSSKVAESSIFESSRQGSRCRSESRRRSHPLSRAHPLMKRRSSIASLALFVFTTVSQAQVRKFDFGPGELAAGYTRVLPETVY